MDKRILLAALVAMASLQAGAQRLTVEKETVDCGSVAYDAPVTAVFELRNKGARKLKINDVRVSCGCIGVDYPKGEVGGGDRFKVRLTYDARQLGHFEKTAGIYSNPHSPLSEAAEIGIEMMVGPEFITGSSRMKSGTGQKMILNMISSTLMIKLGRVQGNSMVKMRLNNRKLWERGTSIIMKKAGLPYAEARELLQTYKDVAEALKHAGDKN